MSVKTIDQWPVGCNFVPTYAVNDIEIWRKDTFDPKILDRELCAAARIGMNSVRIFLSFAVWHAEGSLFLEHFETFLGLANAHGLTAVPVLFDDCAFDFGAQPAYGAQPEPVPGVHNSRWVPSPGFSVQDDPAMEPALNAYVTELISAHRSDSRILFWDLYNEPGNTGRYEKCIPLLRNAFRWAREAGAEQPLSADIWTDGPEYVPVFDLCLRESDVLSLHGYFGPEKVREFLNKMKVYGKPIMYTEWMHRPNGSTIKNLLSLFREENVGSWQWGLIVGRTQTNLSWATMNGGTPETNPVLWQHDLLYPDLSPYDAEELRLYNEAVQKR